MRRAAILLIVTVALFGTTAILAPAASARCITYGSGSGEAARPTG